MSIPAIPAFRGEQLREVITWHPVSTESLPDADLTVLLRLDDGDSCAGFCDGSEEDGTPIFRDVTAEKLEAGRVTHWADMPGAGAVQTLAIWPAGLLEGWTEGHDDEHTSGEMALAAACYAAHTATWEYIGHGLTTDGVLYEQHRSAQEFVGRMWPWAKQWWKPKDERSNLVRATALLLAEIERRDRAAGAASSKHLTNNP